MCYVEFPKWKVLLTKRKEQSEYKLGNHGISLFDSIIATVMDYTTLGAEFNEKLFIVTCDCSFAGSISNEVESRYNKIVNRSKYSISMNYWIRFAQPGVQT